MTAHSRRRFASRSLSPRAPSTRGGASSMLRLSSAARLPAAPEVEQWVQRAARALAAPLAQQH
jgi:hypothetical protein